MKNAGVGTEGGERAKKMLDEYMKDFEKRNPNFIVFNAIMHLDEATPHLHISFREGTLCRRAVDTSVSPEEVVIMNEQTERLYQGMDKLSPKQRSRLIYYYFHKMSFTEIAEIEGCCRQVVQRSIENAKKKLKKFLE